jgi:hypothetical protein
MMDADDIQPGTTQPPKTSSNGWDLALLLGGVALDPRAAAHAYQPQRRW